MGGYGGIRNGTTVTGLCHYYSSESSGHKGHCWTYNGVNSATCFVAPSQAPPTPPPTAPPTPAWTQVARQNEVANFGLTTQVRNLTLDQCKAKCQEQKVCSSILWGYGGISG